MYLLLGQPHAIQAPIPTITAKPPPPAEHPLRPEYLELFSALMKDSIVEPRRVLERLSKLALSDSPYRIWAVTSVAEFHYLGFGTPKDVGRALAILRPLVRTSEEDALLEDQRHAEALFYWIQISEEVSTGSRSEAVRRLAALRKTKHVMDKSYITAGLTLAYSESAGVARDRVRALELWRDVFPYFEGAALSSSLSARLGSCGHDWWHLLSEMEGSRYRPLIAQSLLDQAECWLSCPATNRGARLYFANRALDQYSKAVSWGAINPELKVRILRQAERL